MYPARWSGPAKRTGCCPLPGRFLKSKTLLGLEKRQSRRMDFNHEVTAGSSHWRELVVYKNVRRKVPKGWQAYHFALLPVVPFRTKHHCRMLFHGPAPAAVTFRHFVTQPHPICRRRSFALTRCFLAQKALHGVELFKTTLLSIHITKLGRSKQAANHAGPCGSAVVKISDQILPCQNFHFRGFTIQHTPEDEFKSLGKRRK